MIIIVLIPFRIQSCFCEKKFRFSRRPWNYICSVSEFSIKYNIKRWLEQKQFWNLPFLHILAVFFAIALAMQMPAIYGFPRDVADSREFFFFNIIQRLQFTRNKNYAIRLLLIARAFFSNSQNPWQRQR